MINSFKIYVERLGRPNNFRNNDESLESHRRLLVEQEVIARALDNSQYIISEDGVEKELRKQKEQHTKMKMAGIREEHKEELDQ